MPLNLVKQRVYYSINCHLVKKKDIKEATWKTLQMKTLKNGWGDLYIQHMICVQMCN